MKKKASVQRVLSLITKGYLLGMIFFLPLVFGTDGFSAISGVKWQFFIAVTGVYIAAMVLVSLESLLVGEWKLRSPKALLSHLTPAQWFAVGYLVFTWVSALVSPYFPQTVTGGSRHENAITISLCVIGFLFVSHYGRPSEDLLWAAGASSIVVCVVSFLQFAGLNPFGLYPDGMNYYDAGVKYSGEYLGTIGNVDFAAAYFCLLIPVLWIALVRLSGKRKFWLSVPLLCSAICLLKMNVMAGLVGVLCGGVLCLAVVLPIDRKKKKLLWMILGGFAAVAVVLVYFVDFSGSLHELHEILHGRIDESFGSGRVHIWTETIKKIPEHLWFGAGPDTMLEAELEAFSRYDENLGIFLVGYIDAAHNEYLHILFCQGIFALLSYLAMLGCAAWQWLKSSENNAVAAIVGGAILCYCIQALFGISQSATTPLFWLALGLLQASGRKVEHSN